MAEISKITIPVGGSTQTFDIKDAIARAAIADVSNLGDLAFKDTATGTATNPTTDSIYKVTSTGSMPTYTVSNETLTITAGITPQLASTATTVISAIGTVEVS